MPADFTKRLTAKRPYSKKTGSERPVDTRKINYLLLQYESDRGRIMQSAAVRRLQQKTQVFPLEKNAAVRSRLTHSLEVQQNGRFIVRKIIDKLDGTQRARLGLSGNMDRALETLVEMACLMHDIGNPPFGHFGEAAINDWFNANTYLLFQRHGCAEDALANDLITDLKNFEGNAQAIRLTHKLLKLNLTYAQSAGLLKYTRGAYQAKPKGNYLQKKPGFYWSEKEFVDELWQALAMQPHSRHPIAYIMEAADDISYCLADIEDAVEKGILTIPQLMALLKQEFSTLRIAATGTDDADADIIDQGYKDKAGKPKPLVSFQQLLDNAKKKYQRETVDSIGQFFIELRVGLIHPLVEHAAKQFIEHLDAIDTGDYNAALLEDGSVYQHIIKTMKQVAFKHVFNHPEVEQLELQGYQVINGLLNTYAPLLHMSATDFAKLNDKGPILNQRLYKRLPAKELAAYQQVNKDRQGKLSVAEELYYRCRLLQDVVSGMTDHAALQEYQILQVQI